MSPPLVVGLSGPTCSGKSTIARFLQAIFPRMAVLHEDDFYYPAADLPYRAGFQNWDSPKSIDQERLISVLQYVRSEGRLPSGFTSYEGDTGPTAVEQSLIERLRGDVSSWATGQCISDPSAVAQSARQVNEQPELVLMEGFLLFGKSMVGVRDALELRILLPGKYEEIKGRRNSRRGYKTDEGFWEDPKEYFDLVVWPEYVEEHAFLFKGQNVASSVCEETLQNEAVQVCPEESIENMLIWAVEKIKESLAQHKTRNKRMV